MANLVFDFLHHYQRGERRESDPANTYQYDEGHVIEAVLPETVTSVELHYWARGMEEAEAYTPSSITTNNDGSCTVIGSVPNRFFETDGDLRVYIVVNDAEASITTYEGKTHVVHRAMPDDYVDDDPENEATRVLTEAQAAATTATQQAQAASASAGQAQQSAQTLSQSVEQIETNTADITQLKEDITSLENRVDAIEEADGLHRYGVSGIGQAAVALTRIWDSVGMTAQVGTDGNNSNVVNNFDDVTPFNRRKCVGDFHIEDGRAVFTVNAYLGDDNYVEDGTMGKFVAVECPRAFYYMKDGILGVSAHQYPGWKPFDIFCHKHNQNETIPYYYMPAYALAIDENGEAVSLPGYDNAQGDYKSLLDKARTYKGGELGNLAMLMPAAMNFYEWALYTVEFATQNCQSIMQGCAGLRHSNDDHCTFKDATHVLTNNYYAARVVGEYVSIIGVTVDCNNWQYQATHKIVSIIRCDENGNASSSGTHQLIELEDLGKTYYTYDTTGATEYRFVARPYRTGECNGVSTPSGSPVSNADSYHPCKYRWHENPFSNQYKTTVDLFNERVGTADDNYYLKWYLLDDPTSFESKNIGTADLETDAFVELDIETAHENYVNGYIKSKKYSDMYNGIWIPYETSGGSYNTYFCDYASLVHSNLVRSVRFGGNWNNGSNDGFSYANANNAPSNANANYGGDLYILSVEALPTLTDLLLFRSNSTFCGHPPFLGSFELKLSILRRLSRYIPKRRRMSKE